MQRPENPDFLLATKYFKECLKCPYEATRCLEKLQIIWRALMSMPNTPTQVYIDIAEVRRTHMVQFAALLTAFFVV